MVSSAATRSRMCTVRHSIPSSLLFLTSGCLCLDQHIFQDQIALLFKRMFSINPPPSHSFRWFNIIRLLLRARRAACSPLSRQILPVIFHERLPAWIRTQKSAHLLYGIGERTHYHTDKSWEHGIQLFTHLDKIMVDMCSGVEGVEGLDEGSVEKWRELRIRLIEKTNNLFWGVPEHLRLSEGHFDNLPEHGPLPGILPTLPTTDTDALPRLVSRSDSS